jgi:hypothetical protein
MAIGSAITGFAVSGEVMMELIQMLSNHISDQNFIRVFALLGLARGGRAELA